MKGPNPFALWEDNPENMSGRKDESRVFNGFVNAILGKQGGLLLLHAGPGVGKSMLLRLFKAEAEKAGLLCVLVNTEYGEGMEDLLGKLAREASLKADGWDSLARALEKEGARGHFGVLVLMDDLDLARKDEEALAELLKQAKAAWGKKSIGFVVSSTKESRVRSELVTLVDLKPFGEHDSREFMEKALKKGPPKMGEECLQSLMADTGGNPRLLKTVCRVIYEKLRDNEKIITKGHYLGYLPQIMSTLSREWFGRMYQETPASERRILGELSKREEGAHVSDLAKALGRPLGPTTALMKRLLDRGQVVRLDRGKYRIFAKLYGKYVKERS